LLSSEIDSDVYIEKSDLPRIQCVLNDFPQCRIISDFDHIDSYSKIIVDKRELEESLYHDYLQGRNIIAIDEGGSLREKFPYLIDILPLPTRFGNPNIRSVSFLNLPEKKNVKKNGRILVSFGGEDPRGLTEIFCRDLLEKQKDLISYITIVLGPLYKGKTPDPDFHILNKPSTLTNILPEYNGLICSFGITAFEANHLNIPVLLINPGEYHEELSQISGFESAGVQSIDMDKVTSFITNPQNSSLVKVDSEEMSLSNFLNNLDDIDIVCPTCSSRDFKVKARFKWRTYNRCGNCGMLYMLNYNKNRIKYDKEYFFNQYENQYGKTYLDDFEHIAQLASDRLKIITKIHPAGKTIIDVGCAYGPFLKKARDLGYQPFGTDISEDAVSYVNDQLEIEVICSQFDKFSIPQTWGLDQFDILTMWYVIEHFKDLTVVLKKINTLLKVGGIFSFSTPSGSGISSKNNEVDFLKNSPDDHYTIWEPERSGQILDIYGFKVVKRRITGHHPERFNSFLSKRDSGRKILGLKSRILELGDTFEIYAEKVRDL